VQIWEMLYNGVRHETASASGHAMPELSRRGLSLAAISAVDIALWDILGKSLGQPVWRLLGGRKADRMPAYASGGWAPADKIGEQLQSYIAQSGFRAVKMRVGAMDGAPHRSAARVKAARDALGPDVELMVDAHGTYTVANAKRFIHLIADCDLAWFEEPVIADDKPGMAEVRAFSPVIMRAINTAKGDLAVLPYEITVERARVPALEDYDYASLLNVLWTPMPNDTAAIAPVRHGPARCPPPVSIAAVGGSFFTALGKNLSRAPCPPGITQLSYLTLGALRFEAGALKRGTTSGYEFLRPADVVIVEENVGILLKARHVSAFHAYLHTGKLPKGGVY
jgi:hypothetical protein